MGVRTRQEMQPRAACAPDRGLDCPWSVASSLTRWGLSRSLPALHGLRRTGPRGPGLRPEAVAEGGRRPLAAAQALPLHLWGRCQGPGTGLAVGTGPPLPWGSRLTDNHAPPPALPQLPRHLQRGAAPAADGPGGVHCLAGQHRQVGPGRRPRCPWGGGAGGRGAQRSSPAPCCSSSWVLPRALREPSGAHVATPAGSAVFSEVGGHSPRPPGQGC